MPRKEVPVEQMVDAGLMSDEAGATAKLDARLEVRTGTDPILRGQTDSREIRTIMADSLSRLVREVYPENVRSIPNLELWAEDRAISIMRTVRFGTAFNGVQYSGPIPVKDYEYEDFEIPKHEECEDK